jgi:enoyl-CoA hydratase
MERSFEHLSLSRVGGVLTCTISNPPSHTLNAKGVMELLQLVEDVGADPTVRVLVFTGADPNIFIAHYEVGELSASADRAVAQGDQREPGSQSSARPDLHPMNQLCLRLEALDAITIAAINGFAAGGGCELTLACDFRLMSDAVRGYGLPETSVGIIPGAGGTQRFARLLGTARALDLILHAKLISPDEALARGLVHRVYAADRFSKEVGAFAADLAMRAPIALAAAKRAIHGGAALAMPDALAHEQKCFERAMRTKDATGAMKAFLSGGQYQWKGE